MYRILLVTDSDMKDVKADLRERGYNISSISLKDISGGKELPEKLDMLIIDLSVNQDLEIIKHLKKEVLFKELPIIALLKRESLKNVELSGIVNDFVSIPYSLEEIEFRIRFALWRLNRVDVVDGLRFKDLTIDFSKYEVIFKGSVLDLAYKEYELLKFLAAHPGKVFTREALLDKVWGYNYYGGTRTVDVHIRRLRSKIEDERHTYIDTVRNVGYRFAPPPDTNHKG